MYLRRKFRLGPCSRQAPARCDTCTSVRRLHTRCHRFFSRLEITEEGRFNLQTVAAQPQPQTAAAAPSASAPAPAAAPAAPPGAVSAAADSSVLSRLPVELVIEGMQFSNGRIDFRDRFIRPNYSADLSELNGRRRRVATAWQDLLYIASV